MDPTDCGDPAVQYNLQGRQDHRSVVYSSQRARRLRQPRGAPASNNAVQHSDQAADKETEGHAQLARNLGNRPFSRPGG